jgi:hypothetical protein
MQITNHSSPTYLRAGGIITSVVVVTNENALAAPGVTVISNMPVLGKGMTRTWTATMIGAVAGGALSGNGNISETLNFPALSQKSYVIQDSIPITIESATLYINRASYQQPGQSVIFVDAEAVYVTPYGGIECFPAGMSDCDILDRFKKNGGTTGCILDVVAQPPTSISTCGIKATYKQTKATAPSAGLPTTITEPGWNSGGTFAVNEICATVASWYFNAYSSQNAQTNGPCADGVFWRFTVDGTAYEVRHPAFPAAITGEIPCPVSGIGVIRGDALMLVPPGAHTISLEYRRMGLGKGEASLGMLLSAQ